MPIIRTACAHDCPDQCSLLAHVEDGRLTKLQGDPDHVMTAGFVCTKVNREHEALYSPDRIATPLRRAGAKGEGRFVPISWPEALDEIVGRWQAIIREDGPLALLGYAYSAHQGQINRGLLLGLFHALGVTRLQAGTVCDSCAEAGWDAACGSVGGADPETVVHSDLVIAWGADLMTTNLHIWPLVERARRAGAKVVVIEPRRSQTAERADWHVRVNVGSDAALALGLMHVLARDGLCDRDYLARKTLGFERLEREVLPRFDPARVAAITGVPAADVERLAHMYGRARAPFIRLGEGMSRSSQGGQAIRTVALLPGVVGAYDCLGGGALLMTATSFGLDTAPIRKPSGPVETRLVNHSRLGEALLHLERPRIRGLFVAANNPAVTCPDVLTVRRGLSREDLFTVVHDPFLSDTARYADIVLPAATYLESEDVVRSYGTYYAQFVHEVVPPRGEAWSNRRLAQELGQRLGLADPVFSMGTDELVRLLFEGATGTAAGVDPSTLRTAGPIKLAPPPEQRFTTPSGKLEFYSEALERQGLPAMPDWVPDPVGEEESRRWPLRLLTAPGYYQSHTAFSGIAALRRRQGPPACVLHPDEAAARGLSDGDAVELLNDRGSVRFVLRVSDEAPLGVAFVSGQRPSGEAIAGTINMLCSDRYSDMGEGATYQDTRLDVRAAGPRRRRGCAAMTADHREAILDQFTRQAVPFSTSPGIKNEQTLSLLVEASGAGPTDTVLDVACGGGNVVCAFARVVRHATGIDLTPAMIEQAKALEREQGLANVSWRVGDVLPLPFADGAFSIVTARYAFHHFLDPRAVLAEMKRVCARGGRVLVADTDASSDPAKAAELNRMEKLRDPSHVRAMPRAELMDLFRSVGLPEPRLTRYRLESELEGLLSRSFPLPGDADKIRALFSAALEDDRLGLPLRREQNQIHLAYPIAVLVATNPA